MVAPQVGQSTIVQTGLVATFVYEKGDIFSEVDYVGEHFVVNAASRDLGGLNPIYQKNPNRPNDFKIVDFTRSAPALGETTINEHMLWDVAAHLEQYKDNNCPIVIILALQPCGRQDEIYNASSWLLIDRALLTNLDFGAIGGALDGESTMVAITGTMPFLDFGRVYPILFGEIAGDTVLSEVLDVIYAGEQSCGSCAPASDGCDLYALTSLNSGSPGLSSQVISYIKGVATNYDISTLGAKSGNRMTSVGSKIVVVSEADGAHHVAAKSDLTSWSRVSSGYQAGGSPRCIVALDARNVFIGGAGGYIYKSTNVETSVTVVADNTGTTENANDIHGVGQTIVCVHDNNVIQYSTNGGKTFAVLTGPNVGQNLTAVWVKTKYAWEVGDNEGMLWQTADGGLNWTQKALPNQSNITVIDDIKYSPEMPDELGAISVQVNGAGAVYRTITGGREWTADTGVIDGLPLSDRINAVAWCGRNTLAAGGLDDATTDGILAVGASSSG